MVFDVDTFHNTIPVFEISYTFLFAFANKIVSPRWFFETATDVANKAFNEILHEFELEFELRTFLKIRDVCCAFPPCIGQSCAREQCKDNNVANARKRKTNIC